MAGAAPGAERNAQARRGRSTAQRGTAATCRHRRAAPRFLPPPLRPGSLQSHPEHQDRTQFQRSPCRGLVFMEKHPIRVQTTGQGLNADALLGEHSAVQSSSI